MLDASIETDGRKVWRGEWEEQEDEDGVKTITCPTADSLGSYAYFELHAAPEGDDGEYLAGIISDNGTEKQYIRFVRKAD